VQQGVHISILIPVHLETRILSHQLSQFLRISTLDSQHDRPPTSRREKKKKKRKCNKNEQKKMSRKKKKKKKAGTKEIEGKGG